MGAARATRLRNVGVYLIFFLSGAASLICEVVWFKQLQFVLGSSTRAVSVVVACFFGGLALGSYFGGRWADRWQRPLRAYALLELTLAILSAVVAVMLSQWTVWGEWFAPWLAPEAGTALPLTVSISLVILLPPTALMGATLPVLTRHLVRQRGQLARRVGVLYGLNTLGAATGCALVGFVLIGLYGVVESALIASAVYLVVAVLALFLARGTGPLPSSVEPETQYTGPAIPHSAVPLIAVFALSGFAAIGYEVLWFRVLRCFSIPTVYAFSGLLTVYLLGLVIGAFLCARYIAPRKDSLLTAFAVVQLLTAVAALFSLALLGKGRNLLTLLGRLEPQLGSGEVMVGTFAGVVPFVGLAFLVLLLPTVVLGIAFPLAAELSVQRLSHLGSRVGTVYAFNTLGGVLGSLLTGFVFLPFLGSFWTFALLIGLNAALFLAMLVTIPSLRARRPLWRVGALGVAYLVFVLWLLGPDYLKAGQTGFAKAEVLDFRESHDATFAVLQYDFPWSGKYQQLVANGTSYANNFPTGRRYMGMLGHLPALLHPDPKSAVVICIGTGTTVGSLSLHSEVEAIDAVDIAEDVFRFAPHFVPLNQRFMESPKVKPIVADGRHYLLSTDKKFDVMTFEPPPPQEAGVVNLYSREFYQLAKNRLAPGGILCQWMMLDLSHEVLGRMMLRTLLEEFPYVTLWIPTRYEGVAIASNEPLPIDVDRLRRRMSQPAVQADMTAAGLGRVEQVLSTFVTDETGLREYVGDWPVVTDDQPRIEYFNFYPLGKSRFDAILGCARPVGRHVRGDVDAKALETDRAMMRHLWYAYELERDRKFDDAMARLRKAREFDPDNPYLQYRIGSLADKLNK